MEANLILALTIASFVLIAGLQRWLLQPERARLRIVGRTAKRIRAIAREIEKFEGEIRTMQTDAFLKKVMLEGMRYTTMNSDGIPFDTLFKHRPQSEEEAKRWIADTVYSRGVLRSRALKKLTSERATWKHFAPPRYRVDVNPEYRAPAIKVRVADYEDVEDILERHERQAATRKA